MLPARDLLAAPIRREHLDRIEELAGTTRSHFETYYLAAIRRYALWAQQLPASEAHHHAYPGGLLDHGLEVAVAALRIRQGFLLPPAAPPEEAVLKKDLWTFAVFTLAVLHDAAKPAVDQTITLYGGDPSSSWTWNPWAGPLGADAKARWYRVAFRRKRDYRLHQQACLLLAPRLVGPDGLAWLQSDPAVWNAWLAYAAGDTASAGVLADILSRADSASVAGSLGAGASASSAVHDRPVSLHEKLAATLRHLIDSGDLPLNRRGATGWCTGDDLWLVSKAAMDALRATLLRDGHAGVPADNNRLFDVLQDHGLVTPNAEGRAIWRMTVNTDGQADTLTLIRVPVARLWPDPATAPPAFGGTVEASAAPAPTTGLTPAPAAVAGDTEASRHSASLDPTPAPSVPPSPLLSPTESAAAGPTPARAQPLGEQFLNWLAEGLQSGHLPYNTGKSRVHVVSEGVLLASPGIFRDYAAETGADWTKVQRAFLRLDLHRVTTAGHNIHTYAIARSGSVLTGCLLPDAAPLFGALIPDPNPLLARQ